jgi:hypothetical protein
MDTEHRKEKAAQCRRLGRLASYLWPGAPARETLLKLAEEYETAIEPFDGERHHEYPPEC